MRLAENILAFGDSSARGHGAANRMGWLQRLREHYLAANWHSKDADFHDLTIAGETSTTFATRAVFSSIPRTLLSPRERRTLSIISLGVIEPGANVRAGRRADDFASFAKFLTIGVRSLLEVGDIMHVGIPPPNTLHFAHGDPVAAAGRRATFLKVEDLAATIVAREAAASSRQYGIVPLYELLEHDEGFGVAEDKVHPSEEGHARIYDIVRPVFDDLVG